jgi:hypothetical protein
MPHSMVDEHIHQAHIFYTDLIHLHQNETLADLPTNGKANIQLLSAETYIFVNTKNIFPFYSFLSVIYEGQSKRSRNGVIAL